MSTLSIRLPDSLHNLAKTLASQDQVSMNQFITSSVAEKISALATQTYLKERAECASLAKFNAAIDAVPAQAPMHMI